MALLHSYLSTTTIPFVLTREPGGTPLGERLRDLLSDPDADIPAEAEALILSASRAVLVDKVIEPALAAGKLVICDRFWDSTIAYQGFGRRLDVETLMRVTAFAARRLEPDLTVLLDLPVDALPVRLDGRSGFADRIEREDRAFHERVAAGYRRLSEADPQRFLVLDGMRPEDELAQRVRDTVLARWRQRRM